MRTFLTSILYLSALSSLVYGQGLVWEAAPDLSVPRHEVATTLGKDGRIYAIGGWRSTGNLFKSVEAFDEATQTWIPNALPDLPIPCAGARAVTDSQGRIWLVGGNDGLDTVKVYDSANPSGGWQVQSAKLNVGRTSLSLVILPDDTIYAIGGGNASGALKSVEKYDPDSGQWTLVAELKEAKYGMGCAVDPQGRIYVFGGNNGIVNFATLECYDPVTNRWEQLRNVIAPASGMAAFFLEGKLWNVGGWDTGMLSQTTIYDPASNSWTQNPSVYPNLYEGRVAAGTVISKTGWIYIIGGQNYGGTATSHVARMKVKEDVPCAQWKSGPNMSVSRHDAAIVQGKDNQIYAIGGCWAQMGSTTQAYDTVDVFDGVRWSISSDRLPAPRSGARGVVDSTGRIWVVGGGDPTSNTVLFYQPGPSSGWQMSSNSMNVARSGMGVAITPDDTIYAFGGANASGYLRSVEKSIRGGPWSQVAPMKDLRYLPGFVYHNGYIYAMGGQHTTVTLSSAERLNLATGQWESLPDMPGTKSGPAAFVCHGEIYVIGGWGPGMTSSCFVLNPTTLQWRNESKAALYEGFTCGGSGIPYIVGGQRSAGYSSDRFSMAQFPSPAMASIPAGTFQMGSFFVNVPWDGSPYSEGVPSELPVHTVTLDSFYLGKYEITNAQFCAYLNSALSQGLISVTDGVIYQVNTGSSYPYFYGISNVHLGEGPFLAFSNNSFTVGSKDGRDMSNDPVSHVTWYGAAAYCNWLSGKEGRHACYNLTTWACDFTKDGYRLATEAEWEYVGRGGLEGKRFPWGDTITHDEANYDSTSALVYDLNPTPGYDPDWSEGEYPYTSPVGSYPPNGFGVYDMASNVYEWCNDWFAEDYYSHSPSVNPTGPASGTIRVIRSGAWSNYASYSRVAMRGGGAPTDYYYSFGFRITRNGETTPQWVLYETDFSTDPGWITDQPENFYWDSATHAYHFRGSNTQPEPYAPMNRYYGYKLPSGIGSFVVEWDLYLTRLDWSAGIGFGLFDENRQMFGGQSVWVDFSSVDRGRITSLFVFGAEGQEVRSSDGGIIELNRRYSCRIAYDAPTRQVHYEIRIRRTGELVWSVSVSVPGGFTKDLRFLGGTREGVRPPYTGVNPSAVSEGMIDNVRVTAIINPSLLSPKGGEIWLAGTKQTIEWSACPSQLQVRLDYSSDAGLTWNPIGVVSNTGKYLWEVPSVNSEQCRLRVSDPRNPGQSDMNQEVFTIFVCQRKLLGDLNGDCYTNLVDLAILAEEWLRCGNPLDPICGIEGKVIYDTRSSDPVTVRTLHIKDLWTNEVSDVYVSCVPDGGLVGEACWSRDGEWITFLGGLGTQAQIYVMHPDGSECRRVTGGRGDLVNPCFSPDGSQIVYHQVFGNLSIINRDGTNRRDLGVYGQHPDWSPDGSKIVFGIPGWGHLYMYEVASGAAMRITRSPDYYMACWSPDQTKLAVACRNPNTGSTDIGIMNPDGSGFVDLTADWASSFEGGPAWLPNGQRIFFFSDHDGSHDIWSMKADGSDRKNLTNTPSIDEASPSVMERQ